MSTFQAVIMGIIQGLTEFLPVSSSGHLVIFRNLFGIDVGESVLFDVLMHLGTFISICVVFYKDILKLIVEFIGICFDVFANITYFFGNLGAAHKKSYRQLATTPYRRFVIMIIISTIPTGVLAILLKKFVDYASTSLLVPGICLLINGVILFISDYISSGDKRQKESNWGDAFCIGCAQGVATLPGLSRSGSTITAALLCGFDRRFAVKYSFIMSLPAVLGAVIMEIPDLGEGASVPVGGCLLGMLFAAVVGYFALIITNKLVKGRFFKYFAIYSAVMGAVAVIAFLIKM